VRVSATTPRSDSRPRRPASRASTARRSSRDRHAVSLATSVARHSEISPSVNAANVCGISLTSASARPTSRPPRCGDSCRANATWAPMPLPRSSRRTPAACWVSSCDPLNATENRACTAAAAPFNRSKAAMASIRPASSSSGDISARRISDPRMSATVPAASEGAVVSLMCSNLRSPTDKNWTIASCKRPSTLVTGIEGWQALSRPPRDL